MKENLPTHIFCYNLTITKKDVTDNEISRISFGFSCALAYFLIQL